MASIRLTLAAVLVLALVQPATAGGAEVSVGDFVQRLAQAKNLDSTEAGIAVDSLRQSGIRLPVDLDLSRGLTEGDVARIARAVGLSVSTNRPEAEFSGEQVDKFFASFQVEMALSRPDSGMGGGVPRSPNGPFNPYTKGRSGMKGKKKGHARTPSEPE